MASTLTHLRVPDLYQGGDDIGTTGNRERRAHAESWTVAMTGGSIASGKASSS